LKLAIDSAKANALRQSPKPNFEFLRNKLLEQLKDSNHRVRIAASLALLKIDLALKEAIETLVEVVSKVAEDTPDPSKEKLQEELLIAAIDAIGLFEGEAVEAVLPISLHLNSRNLNIRAAAAIAIEKIGPGAEEAIPLLGIAMRDTESHSVPIIHMVVDPGDDAARALGSIGLAAVPILLDSLNDPEAVVRIRAARELGRIQEAARQTVIPLMAKLSDANAGVRLEAIKALGRLGKESNAVAPALTKFLFTTEALISFPSGGGIGITDPISPEALRALRSIEASEAQIVPVILDALARNENLTLEAVAVLRQYPNRSNAFEIPLRRLLGEKKLGAACALAALGANDSAIQAVLAKNLIENRRVNSVAALGIGQLVAHGVTLEDAVFAQLSVAAGNRHVPLAIWTILLRLTPGDNAAVAGFMVAARNASSLFDPEIDWEEAESALVELIGHQSVHDAVFKELDNPGNLIQSQFLSARVLITSNQKQEQAFACIERECSRNGEMPQFGRVAEFLFKLRPSEQSRSLLVKLLARDDAYVVHGCFSGNGSEKLIVGDRAALALVHHNEVSALSNQLASDNVMVRLRVVRALAACGVPAITPKLVEMAKDLEASVRKEVIRTLGKIGLEHPEMRNELRPVLEAATQDGRRSVSDEAVRMLKRWPEEN